MNRSELAEIWEEYGDDPPTDTRRRRPPLLEIVKKIEQYVKKQGCTDKPSSPAALARFSLPCHAKASICSRAQNLSRCAPRYMYWVKEEKTIRTSYETLVREINSARTLMQLCTQSSTVKKYRQLVREYDKLFPGKARPSFTPVDWLDR